MRSVPSPAIDIIVAFEGFSAKPYLCPAGIPTIGYGSTQYRNGKKITLKDPAVTKMQAMDILLHEAQKFANAVDAMVHSPMTDNQFSALISFAYNLGSGRLRASTLLRKINRGDYFGAANEFDKWVFAGRKKLKGLVRRRSAEKWLFLCP